MFLRSRSKINVDFNIHAQDIKTALADYNLHKGLGRYLLSQTDIAKLKQLKEKLGRNACLNSDQAFELVSILINREGTQNSASDHALQILENYIYDMVMLVNILKKHGLFCKPIFLLIYEHCQDCKVIRENLTLLENENITIKREYAETICEYSKEKEIALPFIIKKCEELEYPRYFIQLALTKILQGKIEGTSFLKDINILQSTNASLQFRKNFEDIYSDPPTMNENKYTF